MSIPLSLLILVACIDALVESRECNPTYEYPCDNGECVNFMQWCDTIPDCLDKSDELYCHGEIPCLDEHYPCRNGKCIPLVGFCNGYHDCGDLSDESECHLVVHKEDAAVEQTKSTNYSVLARKGHSMLSLGAQSEVDLLAVSKAANYLMEQRDADYGWGSFTPRAVIAMSFARQVTKVDGVELMRKKLNIQLLLDLMQKNNLSLSTLALYINALYASCQDPHNFEGIDLVARLRRDTDAAVESNSTVPLAFLTLCIADQLKQKDIYKLADMFNMKEFERTSSRALIMMTMICYARSHSNVFQNYMQRFFLETPEIGDVYSKALYLQAMTAGGYKISLKGFSDQQLPDGSFGDMLATYYAIPVLMNSSLLDLKCNGTINAGEKGVHVSSGKNHVIYSVWISSGKDVNSHSLTIAFDGAKTFFEIMLIAAARDPFYKFQYDETENGKIIYGIAGIPNDAESGKSWHLYLGEVNNVVVNSVQKLMLLSSGADKVSAGDGDHFVFWFKRDD